ncbi:MAG TPA: alcohol dehydrogenase catalytic domain-containing protein [Clostridiales bacterium]|nr:alcohol dehydrogenase catalytic domain-containing protein [Clostridiales bacterium]HOL91233.1 alcohol dehydrogenase catalytic domain-containing protein [Clostridiales bacterium]HPP36100.1 alcohol dehydrogenase catalytic domain-containing protein [Clostridiales bacterium]
MARMMRAQVIEAPGKMVLKQIPVPEISPDEVLIKVSMCGICGTDWKIYKGEYASEFLPMISGHEFWGVIEEVGSNARGLKKGDRVAVDICLPCGTCYYCRRGDELLCETFTQLGIHTDGAFAEYVKAPWTNCYLIPDEVDALSAAFVEPLTAVMQAAKKMDVAIASSVVVIGTGLGILHGALAKLRGAAPVIVIGRSESKLRLAKQLGADFTININEVDDPVAEVKRLTGGVGADYVLESVGTPETYEQAFSMVRRGGKVEAFGICPPDRKACFSPYEFVLGEKKVSGSCAGIGNDWGDVLTLLKYKRIDPTPMFSMIVPLEELEQALHELRTNKDLIKVFVDPSATERKILR